MLISRLPSGPNQSAQSIVYDADYDANDDTQVWPDERRYDDVAGRWRYHESALV